LLSSLIKMILRQFRKKIRTKVLNVSDFANYGLKAVVR